LCYTALWRKGFAAALWNQRKNSRLEEIFSVGFIGYRRQQEGSRDAAVRIYLECCEEPSSIGPRAGSPAVSCGYAVDVFFPEGRAPCSLRGVDDVLALKKFYKLVFSLEERAREHGNDWRSVMKSPQALLEHLSYTRNARDFAGLDEPLVSRSGNEIAEPAGVETTKGK
jgi:hypothetical protein